VNSVKKTPAKRYVGRGHARRGLPNRQKSRLVAPHREADHRDDGDPERQAAPRRRAAHLPAVADEALQHHVEAPDDQDRGHEVAREDADAREPEEVVEDHHAPEHERDREDRAPAVESVPEDREQVRLVPDPAERGDEDERRDDPRAGEAEDRPGQKCMRLSRARPEIGAKHRVDNVDRIADHRDRDRRGEAVAAASDLETEEHVGEPGDERRPEPYEVPHGTALVERDDAGLTRRVVVLDRLFELTALERQVLAQIVDVSRQLVRVVFGHACLLRRPDRPTCMRVGANLRLRPVGS